MSEFEAKHPRDQAGKFSAHVGADQKGKLGEDTGKALESPQGTVADTRFDIPGGHVQRETYVNGRVEWEEWRLNHGYYGVALKPGESGNGLAWADGKARARWCVERTDGFDEDGDAAYEAVLREIDGHCSALSHIVAHHAGASGEGIRLRVEKTSSGELAVSSYDSRLPLGTVHSDGTYTVAAQRAERRIEPFTGLDYY